MVDESLHPGNGTFAQVRVLGKHRNRQPSGETGSVHLEAQIEVDRNTPVS